MDESSLQRVSTDESSSFSRIFHKNFVKWAGGSGYLSRALRSSLHSLFSISRPKSVKLSLSREAELSLNFNRLLRRVVDITSGKFIIR